MLVAFPVSLIFIFSFLLFFFDVVAANFMPHYALVFSHLLAVKTQDEKKEYV